VGFAGGGPGRSEGAGADDGGAASAPEFAWRGREEAVVYAAAAVAYVALGVGLQSMVLNWIVGPLFLVGVVWASSAVLGRRRGRGT
jgi:hypothetical protein